MQDVPLATARLVLESLVASHARALYPYLRDKRLAPSRGQRLKIGLDPARAGVRAEHRLAPPVVVG